MRRNGGLDPRPVFELAPGLEVDEVHAHSGQPDIAFGVFLGCDENVRFEDISRMCRLI